MPEAGHRKLLLIGWDAADWTLITPLVDAGLMPNLERMINAGVMGNIATLFPALSPMLWTSVATGKRAYKHGVHGFSEPDPTTGRIRPVTILSRETKAVWNILNQNGKRCNVVGWWPSFPAEPLNGVMVADQFKTPPVKLEDPWPVRPGMVHPTELAQHLALMRIHPCELEAEHLLPFVPKAAEIDQEQDKRLLWLAKCIAECSTIHAAATAVMQLEPWDFMAVYYDAIDHFSHGFMRFHPPKQEWVTRADFEMFKDVVVGAYKYHDMMLGVLLKLAGEEATVILMSDHGFHADRLRPEQIPNEPAGPAAEHRQYGIFLMKGPGIKQDQLIYGATLLDVTPTILTLFGLPTGEDMDGNVIAGAFDRQPQIESIGSWDKVPGDSGQHPPETQLAPAETQAAIDQLVALGYIDRPDDDQQKAIAQTVRELQHNLARAYIGGNRHLEAAQIYQKLWKNWPEEHRFGVKLLECQLATGQTQLARKSFDALRENKQRIAATAADELKLRYEERKQSGLDELPNEQRYELRRLQIQAGTNVAALAYLNASILRRELRYATALDQLQIAEQAQTHNRPSAYLLRGEIYLDIQKWQAAEDAFMTAIDLDSENADAFFGLCQSYLPRHRNRAAAEAASVSLGLRFHNPRAHYLYGVALYRCGHFDAAVQAMKTAVNQNPVFPDAHLGLASILANCFEDYEQAAIHQQNASDANQAIEGYRAEQLTDHFAASAFVDDDELFNATTIGAVKSSPQEVITVVSGLPRAGTSMMMQMLRAGGVELLADQVREADDDNPKGYFEFEFVKSMQQDASWLSQAKGKAVKIVAQLIPMLSPQFSYKVIFVDRDLTEVIASQKRMLANKQRQGAQVTGTALAQIFAKQRTRAKMIISKSPVADLLTVKYAEAIGNPQAIAEQVADFLGRDMDVNAMIAAVDPKLYRQKRK